MTAVTTKREAELVESYLNLLRARGQRITTPRRLLVQSLVEAGGHRTAEELTGEVQRRAPDVSASTIYRNLDDLERLGVVDHAHFGHGAATYHLTDDTHGHLVCNDCGEVIEVSDDLFRPLIKGAKTRYQFTIDPHHFAMLGRCRACAEAIAAEPS